MTRQEEINNASYTHWVNNYANIEFIDEEEKEFHTQDIQDSFINGAEWADAHPHWISVDDELPKGEHLSADVLIVGCGEVWYGYYDHDNDQWYPTFSDITHWMPLPQAPSSSEFPNNHIIDANKMVKKGGEE